MVVTESRMENFHWDVLRQVMLHLATSQNGEFEIMKSLFMGNPDLASHFRVFQVIGGFIYRAAKAGNPRAPLILAKLIIMSASELFRAQNEATSSAQTSEAEEKNKLRARARSFLSHFTNVSPQTDPNSSTQKLVHYELARKLLIHGCTHPELIQTMKTYLKDYTSYFLNTSVKTEHHQHFQLFLDQFDMLQPRQSYFETLQLYVDEYNSFCVAARRMLRNMGVRRFPKVSELKLPRNIPAVVDKDFHDFQVLNLIERYRRMYELVTNAVCQCGGVAHDLRSRTIARLITKGNMVCFRLWKHVQFLRTLRYVLQGIFFNFDAMFPNLVEIPSPSNSCLGISWSRSI